MKITDAIALAKAGYKKADIERMLTEEPELTVPDPEPEQAVNSISDDITQVEPDVDEKKEKADIDYKSLYEETQKDIISLREQVKKLQHDNIREDVSNNISNNKFSLDDIARRYM